MRRSLVLRVAEAVILVAVGFTAVRVWQWYSTPNAGVLSREASAPIRVGDRSGPASPGSKSRHVRVLVSTECASCNESLGFYRRLAKVVAATPDADLTFLSDEPSSKVKGWLKKAEITEALVKRVASPARDGFVLTPTVIVLDSNGLVTDLIHGELPVADEELLLRRIRDRSAPAVVRDPLPRESRLADVNLEAVRSSYQVIDIRSRATRDWWPTFATHRIPKDELPMRALAELDRSGPVAIDCANEDLVRCRIAGSDLWSLGFGDVLLIRR